MFQVYIPPPPKEEEDKPLHSADEPEAEKKPEEDSLNRLTSINITLPENVLWFEPPTAVQWEENKQQWTTEYIYDSRFNEEKQVRINKVKMVPSNVSVLLSKQSCLSLVGAHSIGFRTEWLAVQGSFII